MTNPKDTKARLFQQIVDEVSACQHCVRMENSARMLGHSSGNLSAQLMFIGEAPGRLGADQTHIPFHGDTAGANFEGLIEFAGISRQEIYVTNAVLCNPRDSKGNNSTPLPLEISNCGSYLQRQIDLVKPKIVITLGATALRALENIHPHTLSLKEHVRTAQLWYGRLLIPLYHPGQRAMIHRSYANQRSDYQFVADTLRHLDATPRKVIKPPRADVLATCRFLLESRGEVSYFELHKLAYLAEYVHVKRTGTRLTKAYFIRQKDGPYCVDLNIQRLKKSDLPINVVNRAGKLMISLERHAASSLFDDPTTIEQDIRKTLEEVISRYKYPNDGELKKAVYMTGPMRMMLRREKNEGANLYNAPIDFLGA